MWIETEIRIGYTIEELQEKLESARAERDRIIKEGGEPSVWLDNFILDAERRLAGNRLPPEEPKDKVIKNLKFFILLAFVLLAFTACPKKAQTPQGPPIPAGGISLSKFCGQLRDFKLTPQGARVSSCVSQIPAEFLETVDDACAAHIAAARIAYPAWNVGMTPAHCDVLLLEPDGVLQTIPNYPRPFLRVSNITAAGTVLFSNARSIIVLPDFSVIQWQNRHYQFAAAYNEDEHLLGFLNRANPPVNKWLEFTINDVHPQIPPLYEIWPEYARASPSFAAKDPGDLKEVVPVKLPEKTAKDFFDWLDSEQKKLQKQKEWNISHIL